MPSNSFSTFTFRFAGSVVVVVVAVAVVTVVVHPLQDVFSAANDDRFKSSVKEASTATVNVEGTQSGSKHSNSHA